MGFFWLVSSGQIVEVLYRDCDNDILECFHVTLGVPPLLFSKIIVFLLSMLHLINVT